MKRIFDTRKGCMAGSCILSAVLFVLIFFAAKTEGFKGYYFPLAALLAAGAGVFFALKYRFGRLLSILTALAVPFASLWLLQWYTCDPWRMYPAMILVNGVFFYLFYLALAFLLGSFRWGYTIATLFSMILGLVNYFVIEFRSSPIVPWDLMSLGTAASVADNYTYDITWRLLFVTFGFVFLLLAGWKSTLTVKKLPLRLVSGAVCIVGLLAAGGALQEKSVKDALGMDQTLFTPTVRYRNNGFVAAFVGNLHLINIEEPDGYSVERVQQIAASAGAQGVEGEKTGVSENTDSAEKEETAVSAGFDLDKAPNIIVVMNEAFSDLSYLGEFGTNEDYMPFFRRMMEEHTSGKLMVSVKGGNTANTEYEFLSGDSMAFLPAGSVVFQQYIKDAVPTLATHLKELGYSTIGMHPYLGSGWDRDTVYPLLGFDEFLDIDAFPDAEYIRNYVSDQSAFEKIIEVFENKDPGERQFIFEVTMQNHSGYSKDYPGFYPTIALTDFTSTSTSIQAAEKYLTLIQESDKAFEGLISYFEQVEEPTVILMFGDHMPSDYITNVIARITGYDLESSLEEYQKSYQVPFLMWSNFGLEKDENMKMTSVNYLGAYLLDRLDIPLTSYQEYLLKLRESLPVICAGTYIDTEGVYHSYSETDEEHQELLNEYNILQYNHLTDRKHRVDSVFCSTDPS